LRTSPVAIIGPFGKTFDDTAAGCRHWRPRDEDTHRRAESRCTRGRRVLSLTVRVPDESADWSRAPAAICIDLEHGRHSAIDRIREAIGGVVFGSRRNQSLRRRRTSAALVATSQRMAGRVRPCDTGAALREARGRSIEKERLRPHSGTRGVDMRGFVRRDFSSRIALAVRAAVGAVASRRVDSQSWVRSSHEPVSHARPAGCAPRGGLPHEHRRAGRCR
jgi:hypothetical protein